MTRNEARTQEHPYKPTEEVFRTPDLDSDRHGNGNKAQWPSKDGSTEGFSISVARDDDPVRADKKSDVDPAGTGQNVDKREKFSTGTDSSGNQAMAEWGQNGSDAGEAVRIHEDAARQTEQAEQMRGKAEASVGQPAEYKNPQAVPSFSMAEAAMVIGSLWAWFVKVREDWRERRASKEDSGSSQTTDTPEKKDDRRGSGKKKDSGSGSGDAPDSGSGDIPRADPDAPGGPHDAGPRNT